MLGNSFSAGHWTFSSDLWMGWVGWVRKWPEWHEDGKGKLLRCLSLSTREHQYLLSKCERECRLFSWVSVYSGANNQINDQWTPDEFWAAAAAVAAVAVALWLNCNKNWGSSFVSLSVCLLVSITDWVSGWVSAATIGQ